mgnify:FL=1
MMPLHWCLGQTSPISYNVDIQAHVTGMPGNLLNDIWGYVRNGQEFAIVGSRSAINFFNVSDCANPVSVAVIEDGNTVIWRDFKTYGDYAYGVCDGNSTTCNRGLEIFRLSDYSWFRTTAFFSRAHNIFIENGRLYAAGTNTRSNGLIILDIATNPESPSLLASMILPDGYVHDVFVRNDTAYASHGYNGYTVYDFTDLSDTSNPASFIIGSIQETNGYNHSSWIHPHDHYAFIAEEVPLGKPMYVYDLADPANPHIVHTFKNPLEQIATNNVPHNPFVKDDILYIAHYHDGLQIYDVTDPLDPIRIGFYDTYPQNNGLGYSGYHGAWGVYPFLPSGCILVSDIENGFFTFRLSSHPLMSYVQEGDLYLKEPGAGIVIYDRNNEPVKIGIDDMGELVRLNISNLFAVGAELNNSQVYIKHSGGLILTSPGGLMYKISMLGKNLSSTLISSLPDKYIELSSGNFLLKRKGSGIIFQNAGGVCLKFRWDKAGIPQQWIYGCPVE